MEGVGVLVAEAVGGGVREARAEGEGGALPAGVALAAAEREAQAVALGVRERVCEALAVGVGASVVVRLPEARGEGVRCGEPLGDSVAEAVEEEEGEPPRDAVGAGGAL